MNKNTLIVIVIFVALLGAVVAMKFWPSDQKTLSLTVESLTPVLEGTEEGATPLATKKPEEMVDKVEMVRKGVKVVLEQVDEDNWNITAPITASADKYKVTQMLKAFEGKGESVYAKEMSDEDRPYFGLDTEHAIEVTLSKGGQIVQHLFIGAIEKAEMPENVDPAAVGSVTDTFVSDADNAVAYRIAGKDYRTSFDKEVNELRSKKVFTFKKEDLETITIEDPAAKDGQKVVLTATKTEPTDEPEDGAKEPKAKAKAVIDWAITEPAGYKAGSISSYASSLANLFASEFIPKDETPKTDKSGLGKDAFKITITAKGVTKTLLVGNEADAKTYATIDGSGEVFTVSKYTAKNLQKGLQDLRDKKIFSSIDHKMVAKVEFMGGEKPATLTHGDKGWTFVEPAGMLASDDEVDKAVKGIVNLMVDGFHPEVSDADAGLEGAPTVFRLTATDGQVFEIKLGKEEESKQYGKLVGTGEVVTLTKYSANKLVKKADDFRRKKLFTFDKDKVTAVTITRPDETVTLALEEAAQEPPAKKDEPKKDEPAEGAAPAKPPKAAEKVWAFTGPDKLVKSKLDQTKVKTLVSTMANLKAKEIFDAGPPADAAFDKDVIAVKVTLADGTSHAVEISASKKDGDSYARLVGDTTWGKAGFLLNAFQVGNVTKKGSELVQKKGGDKPKPPAGLPPMMGL